MLASAVPNMPAPRIATFRFIERLFVEDRRHYTVRHISITRCLQTRQPARPQRVYIVRQSGYRKRSVCRQVNALSEIIEKLKKTSVRRLNLMLQEVLEAIVNGPDHAGVALPISMHKDDVLFAFTENLNGYFDELTGDRPPRAAQERSAKA